MADAIYFMTVALAAAYALFLCWCISGWLKLKTYRKTAVAGLPENPAVTVVIPARNEQQHILECLSDFLMQDYPRDLFEVIIADDHSGDKTAELAQAFISGHPELRMKLLRLSESGIQVRYKKQAITEAIRISSGRLIVTTDADCRRGPQWISTIAGYYLQHQPGMISGPVMFQNESRWMEKIQSLEFLGLVAIGAASISNGKPLLCNGANLAFSKEIFMEAGGYQGKEAASGDDTQLMLKVATVNNRLVQFIKSRDAVVTTSPQSSVQGLFQQRKRWASKIPRHMSRFTLLIALVAFLLHAALLLSGIIIFTGGRLSVLLLPLMIKMIPEFILLASAAKYFGRGRLLYWFLPAQVIYPAYIALIGLASVSGSYRWKEREVHT